MTIWVLTEEYNDYDQHGEYFIFAWDHKPSREELSKFIANTSRPSRSDYLGFILEGGGRIQCGGYYDDQWFILKELE